MIFGGCPYCDESFAEPVPEKTPVFAKIPCSKCGKEFWLKYSRLLPEAYTLEEFDQKFEIEPDTKTIKPRQPESTVASIEIPPDSPAFDEVRVLASAEQLQKQILEADSKLVAELIDKELLGK